MKLAGSSSQSRVEGVDKLQGISNYFIGNDPTKWRTDVPTYGKVRYERIYPGIDLVYYGNQRQLEYDFVVAPGADPARIRLGFEGARKLRVDAQGDLLAETTGGAVRWQKPVVYQETNGVRKTIEGRYLLRRGYQVSFEVAAYDRAKPLVIDPTLDYSTYLGGNGDDYGDDITVDGTGSAYVIGETSSTNFPMMGAYQPVNSGGSDTFVTKLNPTGSALIYSTYIGGSGNEGRGGIAVDSIGNAYVVGETRSTNFPTTPGAYQTVNKGSPNNAFVTKLNALGNALIYSTYLGGSGQDGANTVAIDSGGNAYVGGQTAGSSDFPTFNAYQSFPTTYYMAYVTKLNATGTSLLYSTYLGGNDYTFGVQGIAADNAGNVYVTGPTGATNFPTRGAFQPSNAGGSDAFVTKLNTNLSGDPSLVYSSYLGGTGTEQCFGLAIDASGNVYVAGLTNSANFPTVNPLQAVFGGVYDAFVAKINTTGSAIVYSTYLGGSGDDRGSGIAVDSSGNAYVTGSTSSINFPTVNPFQSSYGGGSSDGFVAKINAAGSAVVYSTYLGGSSYDAAGRIALDGSGNAYVTGTTSSTNFPTTSGAFNTSYNGGTYDAFVTKIGPASTPTPTTTIVSSSQNPSAYGQSVTFTATVTSGGTPTGTVQFYDGGSPLGGPQTISGGIASISTSSLAVGTHAITASYSGDSSFNGSTSVALMQIVNKANTTTAITGEAPDPSVVGQPYTVSVKVGALAPGSGTPSGGVTLSDGMGATCGAVLSGGSGSCSLTSTTPGTKILTATYLGDNHFNGSSNATTHQVNQVSTSTTLTSSQNPSVYGQAVTFTATVTAAAPSGDAPTGTVTFKDGTTALSTVTLTSGQAMYTTSSLAVGTHPITATYNGDNNFSGSTSPPLNQIVVPPPTKGGSFVIGDLNAVVGKAVTFWGAQWEKLNSLSGGSAPPSFKGFASFSSTNPQTCGGAWQSDPGDSSGPPNAVGPYIAVFVSSSITKSGATIAGNIPQMVIVKTDPGYGPNPGHAGTGTVVAVICP